MKKKKANKKSKMSKSGMLAIGAGVAAVGAGAYYLLGPKSKAHIKKATSLIAKMRKQVMQKAMKAKNLTKPLYHNVVDTVAKQYGKQYKEHGPEIKAFGRKLKNEWEDVAKKVVKKSAKIIKRKR